MRPILLIALIVTGIPWAIRTWWRFHCARGPKERAFIQRSSMTTGMLVTLAVMVVPLLRGKSLLFALPIIAVAGLALQHGWKKGLERVRTEESDPLSKAKRIN